MKLLQHIIGFVAPSACMGCGSEGGLVCGDCLAEIAQKRGTCYRCNALSDGGQTCARCRRQSPLAGVTIAAHYEGVIKDIVWRLKYQQASHVAPIGARLMTPLLDKHKQFDLVTAVPTSPSRRRTRGYDQAELLAQSVARDLGIPYRPALARMAKRHQVGHSRSERLIQVDGLFASTRNVNDMRILLVDDVLTTGATMEACARVLKDSGASYVWGAVMAKH